MSQNLEPRGSQQHLDPLGLPQIFFPYTPALRQFWGIIWSEGQLDGDALSF